MATGSHTRPYRGGAAIRHDGPRSNSNRSHPYRPSFPVNNNYNQGNNNQVRGSNNQFRGGNNQFRGGNRYNGSRGGGEYHGYGDNRDGGLHSGNNRGRGNRFRGGNNRGHGGNIFQANNNNSGGNNNYKNPTAMHRRCGPPKQCQICSYNQMAPERKIAVFHFHFSSKQVRKLAGADENDTDFFCPSCTEKSPSNPTGSLGSLHNMAQMTRIPILISGSTVHEHYMEGGYPGDEQHVDYLTSPGAKIEDLEHMWLLDYADEKKPMDILLIGGLNNFRKDSVEQMMAKFKKFNDAVMSHSAARHPATNSSTFRVATLLLAPQFVWFDDNGDMPGPDLAGYPYVNNIKKMEELNKQITLFNNRLFNSQVVLYRHMNNGVSGTIDKAPSLNRFGVRTKWIKDEDGEDYHVTSHRWNHWREKDKRNMLHLSDKFRNRLANHAIKYLRDPFSPDFSPLPTWASVPPLVSEASQAAATAVTAATATTRDADTAITTAAAVTTAATHTDATSTTATRARDCRFKI